VVKDLVTAYFDQAATAKYQEIKQLLARKANAKAELDRLQAIDDTKNQYRVTVSPSPLKNGPEESERISYADWIQKLY
jgi:hypothetical protein